MGENCGCRKAAENTSAQLKGGVAQAICSSQFIVLFGKFSMGSAAFIYLKFTHFTVIFYYQNHLGSASSLCMSFSPSFKCLTTKPHKQLKILFSIFSQAMKSPKPSSINCQWLYFCCHYYNFKRGPPLECGVPSDPMVQGVYISMSPLVKTTFLPSIWVRDKRWQRSYADKRHRSHIQTTFLRAETKKYSKI